MTVRTDLLALLGDLPGILFVPPSPEIWEQSEVHETARRLVRERGLDADQPYIGWHSQQDMFDRRGELSAPQRIYFGGDLAVVTAGLKTLEGSGFIILGGRSADESFAVFLDAHPNGTDAGQAAAWDRRLSALDEPFRAPLRDGEGIALRAVLRSAELVAQQVVAARVMRERSLLTHDDLDLLLAPERSAELERIRHIGSAENELTRTILYAFDVRYPGAPSVVASLAREGRADAAVLAAWGGEEATLAARERSITTGRDARVYFDLVRTTGGDVISAAIDLAEQRRAVGELPDEMLHAIEGLFGPPGATSSLSAIQDRRLPPWLRAAIGDNVQRRPLTPRQNEAARGDGLGLPPEVVRDLPIAVDDARREAGLPSSPGFDLRTRFAHDAVIEERDYMLATHLDGMRAALRDPAVDEPSAAVLLEIVDGAGALASEDIDVLLQGWRKRLFVKPGTYTPAPPAVVTLAIAAEAAGKPEAAKIVDALRHDKRAWARAHRYAIVGALDGDAETEAQLLEDQATIVGGEQGSRAGQHALVRVAARRRGVDPIHAAAELLCQASGPRYVTRHYAETMVSLAMPGSDLWPFAFRTRSMIALQSALRVVADDGLPIDARRRVFEIAQESSVLSHPDRAYSRPHPSDIERLRGDMTRVGDLLR
ncbi:hypothetical protein [Microbacterium sp. NPDC087665]|uniref:hypothetical protein n=1 Tax=Microbacterium sp. NPDC087665 TaxID=3364194 RepID=UPI00380690B4